MSHLRTMPSTAARVRRSICRQCFEKCPAYMAHQLDHDDPHAFCPAEPAKWSCYGKCGDPDLGRAERPDASALARGRGRVVIRPARARIPVGKKLARLSQALGRWLRGGLGIASRAARMERRLICESCPMWRPAGNAGFGECSDPRCGCTKFKRWLPTETCPQGKWPEAGSQSLVRLIATALKAPVLRVLSDLRRPPDSKTGRNSS
jgi:hypothetical protein